MGTTTPGAPGIGSAPKTRFYGTVALDPVTAKLQFGQVFDDLLLHLNTKPGVQVTVKVDIEATTTTSFDEQTVRTVKENARVLGFDEGNTDFA